MATGSPPTHIRDDQLARRRARAAPQRPSPTVFEARWSTTLSPGFQSTPPSRRQRSIPSVRGVIRAMWLGSVPRRRYRGPRLPPCR